MRGTASAQAWLPAGLAQGTLIGCEQMRSNDRGLVVLGLGLLCLSSACIIPYKFRDIPTLTTYEARCVCSSCATALAIDGSCPQLGIEFPHDYSRCDPDTVQGETSFEAYAMDKCSTENKGGQFACHLIETDPTDTERSKLAKRLSEPSCDATSGALSTDSEDATIALDAVASWISVEHSSGMFKTAVSGVVKFRGGNCDGDGCPLALTYLGIETPTEVTFLHTDGKKTLIKKPFVRVPEVVASLTSKRTTTGPPGFEFSFPKDSLKVWASGTVENRRVLVTARNEEETPTGRLLKNGDFLFDATARVDEFKVRLHLSGRVRTWPPFLRVDRAAPSRRGPKWFVELAVSTFSWSSTKISLQLIGERYSAPVRLKKGRARVEVPVGTSHFVLRACAETCVERDVSTAVGKQESRHAE